MNVSSSMLEVFQSPDSSKAHVKSANEQILLKLQYGAHIVPRTYLQLHESNEAIFIN